MSDLKQELKENIVSFLQLEDIKPEDIKDDAPLFGDGLGLDSIGALELLVMVDKKYGVKLADPAEGKAIFQSVETMAGYIAAHRTK